MSDTYLYAVYYTATFSLFVSSFRTVFSDEIKYKPLFYVGGFLGLLPSSAALCWCGYEYFTKRELYLIAALIYAWIGVVINGISLIFICVFFGLQLRKRFKLKV